MRIEPPRILDFDCESRPLTYLGGDWTTAEITAIACSFGVNKPIMCWLLGRDEPWEILDNFVEQYNQADIVTGHFIRRFDLGLINGALLEYNREPLSPKLTIDTKCDLVPMRDISKSQESIGAMLGTKQGKTHMTQKDWREANRLQRIEAAEKRVKTDVRQHQQMRLELTKLGMLGSPQIWCAGK